MINNIESIFKLVLRNGFEPCFEFITCTLGTQYHISLSIMVDMWRIEPHRLREPVAVVRTDHSNMGIEPKYITPIILLIIVLQSNLDQLDQAFDIVLHNYHD